ncbi:MAG: preprotein translocase subunit SecE [Verrucomicrobiota bacterium]|jgi:preprotein translocase SecE subunit|nr:preprotein translocase subunit SecE [Verrucomicrobiota bacterium]MDP6753559.1 preprotein translocase subunit SecE [Verrucomicrobiota bacterium]
MEETNSNTGAVQATAEVGQPAGSPETDSSMNPLPVDWIIGGVVLLVALFIAKKIGWMDRIRVFFLQTREELLKCTWPNRDELRGSTWMVLVAVTLLGTFTFLADWFLGGLMIKEILLKWIGGAGGTG